MRKYQARSPPIPYRIVYNQLIGGLSEENDWADAGVSWRGASHIVVKGRPFGVMSIVPIIGIMDVITVLAAKFCVQTAWYSPAYTSAPLLV